MKTQNLSFIGIVAFLCAVSAPVSAADGVFIVTKETTGSSNLSTTTEIRIEQSRLQIATIARGSRVVDLLFDDQKRRLLFVSNIAKTYRELSEPDADRYRKEWRELGRTPAPSVNTEYRETGTDTVGMWTCTKYDRYENTRKLEELCVIDLKQLGLAAADFDVVRRYAEFYPNIPPKFSGLFRISRPDGSEFDAFPVRRVAGTGANQLRQVSEIVEVKRQTFGDAVLSVPDGFRRVPVVMPKETGIGTGLGTGVGPVAGVYQPGGDVTTPRLLKEVKPHYTSDAMRERIQGEVWLTCVVRANGSVSDVVVVRSLDRNFGLDEEAIIAAKQWRFAPGTRLGEAVPVRVTIALTFALRDPP